MPYKVLVLDIDDTLLNSNHEISPATYQRLMDLQEGGYYLVLASGRPTLSMIQTARHLKLDHYNSYIISYNGAVVTRMRDVSELYSKRLMVEDQTKLIQDVKAHELCVTTYVDHYILMDYPNDYSHIESELTGIEGIYDPEEVESMKSPRLKIMAVGDPEKVAKWNSELNGHYGQSTYATTSKPYFLEFMHEEVSKGDAIERLCQHLNVSTKQVIACGDGNNDASMIEKAGLGVAMANATDYLKSLSNHITLSNDEDGIVSVIDEFMLTDK